MPLCTMQADMLRRAIHALSLKRVLIFMNFQQRLRDFQYKLTAPGMKVGSSAHGLFFWGGMEM